MTTFGKIALLAGVAFGWGYLRNRGLAAGTTDLSAEQRQLARARLLDPATLAASCLVSPAVEEATFRRGLGGLLTGMGMSTTAGAVLGSTLFGLAHARPDEQRLTGVSNMALALDAFMGGILYTTAFTVGGLPAAIAAHGLHNLGSALGYAAGLER